MNFSIKKSLIFILSIPFLLLILVIGAPFRIFSKLPPITQSVIHSPYSFCVETLSIIESKIDTASEDVDERWSSFPEEFIDISSVSNQGLNTLKDKLVSFLSAS